MLIMLLDIHSLWIIISDLWDSIIQLIEQGGISSAISALPEGSSHALLYIVIGVVIVYFAWRSTDCPDLPPVPQRIQQYFGITGTEIGPGGGGGGGATRQHTATDVRILTTNGPVIDSVLRSFPQRHTQTQHHQHNHSRHGTLFLRFLRRPQSRPLLPLPIPPTVGNRFQQTPNLIVYHQVNVYHHTHPPPERLQQQQQQGRNLNGNTSTSNDNIDTLTTTTTNSGTNNSNSNNNSNQNTETTTSNITTTENNSAIPSCSIGSRNTTTTNNNNASNFNTNAIDRGENSQGNNLGVSTNNNTLNASRRSFSENNVADLEVETNENTVDVVEVEVDDLNDTDGTVQVVDVTLNSDVQLNGLLTMNHNQNNTNNTTTNPNTSTTTTTISSDNGGSNNNIPINSETTGSSSSSSNNSSENSTNMVGTSEDGNHSSKESTTCNTTITKNDQVETPTNPTTTTTDKVPSTTLVNKNTSSANTKHVNSNSTDVRVILKFLNDTSLTVTTQLSEKISEFKRRHFATELGENKIVRLIFNGRVLDDDRTTLQESGIFDQCVVHCLIVTPQPSQQQRGQSNLSTGRTTRSHGIREGPVEPGLFFIAILGIVLLFLWFICLQFRQLFTQSAVISLLILSIVFIFGLVALYLPVQN